MNPVPMTPESGLMTKMANKMLINVMNALEKGGNPELGEKV